MWRLLFFIIVPIELLGETADTIFITDVPTTARGITSSPAETVRVVETVVETLKMAPTTSVGVTSIAQPTKEMAPLTVVKVYEVQVGAFTIKENADKLYKALEPIYGDMVYVENIQPYWKVRIKQYNSWREAVPIREELLNRGYKDAWIVRPGSSHLGSPRPSPRSGRMAPDK